MSMERVRKRSLNILDKDLCEKMSITNVKQIEKDNIIDTSDEDEDDLNILMYKAFEEMYDTKLYEFTIKEVNYVEYISKTLSAHGNYYEEEISFIKKGEIIPETVHLYQDQGYECAKCGTCNSRQIGNIISCNVCDHEASENLFEGKLSFDWGYIKIHSFIKDRFNNKFYGILDITNINEDMKFYMIDENMNIILGECDISYVGFESSEYVSSLKNADFSFNENIRKAELVEKGDDFFQKGKNYNIIGNDSEYTYLINRDGVIEGFRDFMLKK